MSNNDYSEHGPWGPLDCSPSRLKTFLDCAMKYKYSYVDKKPRSTGPAALQGSALHEVFLEEYLTGGIEDVDALVEMLALDTEHRLNTEDPRDWKSKLPLTSSEKWLAIEQVKVWGRGLLEAYKSGEDSYGNKFVLPDVEQTEYEGCLEIYLPKADLTIRIRGYIDLVFKDGTVGDLKLASDYWLSIWTLAKAIGEQQPAMYAKMAGTDTFRYVIVDKKKARDKSADPPRVRTIDYKVTEKDNANLMDQLETFVRLTDFANGHENGIFAVNPEYNGQSKATAGKTEQNFCGKMCDFKDTCFKENFARPSVDTEQ
jgi:hypothetical protein